MKLWLKIALRPRSTNRLLEPQFVLPRQKFDTGQENCASLGIIEVYPGKKLTHWVVFEYSRNVSPVWNLDI